jgi:transketolase
MPAYALLFSMSADSNQAAAALERGLSLIAEGHTSVYTFFPRSGHQQLTTPSGELLYSAEYVFDGTCDLLRGRGDTTDAATIIAVGIPVHDAVAAADQLLSEEKLSIRVLNAACVRPIDASAIAAAALETRHIIVVEDHSSESGLAMQVANVIADFQLPCSLRRLGVNTYFPSATDTDLKFMAGLDVESLKNAVLDEVRKEVMGGDDACTTALYAMHENVQESIYGTSMKRYIDRLIDEKGYMESLRTYWRSKASAPEKMPSTPDLIRQLQGE